MSNWLEKLLPGVGQKHRKRAEIPEGVWEKCKACGGMLYKPELDRALRVCPKCHSHLRLPAKQRLASFFDDQQFERIGEQIEPQDRLKFKDLKKYKDRLVQARKATDETEAIVVASGKLYGLPLIAAAFEFQFMGGSMGAAVGARFAMGVQASLKQNLPFVCFAASGGARMQEGLFSLMQMAKTSAALNLLKERGIPFISVLTDPVYGGVSASFAMLGDVIIAEPGAMIGFAGPRVIEQTVRQTLPEGFQKSEFLLEKGAIDMIVPRTELRDRISTLVRLFGSADLSVVSIDGPNSAVADKVAESEIQLDEPGTVVDQLEPAQSIDLITDAAQPSSQDNDESASQASLAKETSLAKEVIAHNDDLAKVQEFSPNQTSPDDHVGIGIEKSEADDSLNSSKNKRVDTSGT